MSTVQTFGIRIEKDWKNGKEYYCGYRLTYLTDICGNIRRYSERFDGCRYRTEKRPESTCPAFLSRCIEILRLFTMESWEKTNFKEKFANTEYVRP